MGVGYYYSIYVPCVLRRWLERRKKTISSTIRTSRFSSSIGKRWQIDKKLDEGGFGQVYQVIDLQNRSRPAALKVESVMMEGGSAIKLEINVLEQCNKRKQLTHLPILFSAKKHEKYVYMVMELLGKNLRDFKTAYTKDLLPEKDWSRIGLQILHAVKSMHDRGFVHRDLKPANIVFGHQSNMAKFRTIHVLDFGLARGYAFYKKGHWTARKARLRIDFRGTFRYASPNMHRDEDLGRRDDIYSIMYILLEFNVSLPWQFEKDKDKVQNLKWFYEDNPKKLSTMLPAELGEVLPHLRQLTFYSRPNYSILYDGLLAVMKRHRVTLNDRYVHEPEDLYKEWVKAGSKRCQCEDMSAFMKADPIRINGPPTSSTTTIQDPGPTKEDPMLEGKSVNTNPSGRTKSQFDRGSSVSTHTSGMANSKGTQKK
ncbi:unnamed protein product, partial [Mesorhabditis belari]|uniref:non-specific serine/threonine protein kinase n=1 Tax=Mesorhabditis belari TaxID=2138241 RepID=A0AAF3EL02_9BILA